MGPVNPTLTRETTMNAKIQPGGHGRPQYLIRCAFTAAEEGDRAESLRYWQTAIDEGYEMKDRTLKQLMYRIREGESKTSLDLAKPDPLAGLASRVRERRAWRIGTPKTEGE
jgi:hypothetical protein